MAFKLLGTVWAWAVSADTYPHLEVVILTIKDGGTSRFIPYRIFQESPPYPLYSHAMEKSVTESVTESVTILQKEEPPP